MKDFNKKIIYIIGGSSGIGLSTAKLLAKKGAHIFIFARDENRLTSAIADIKSQRISDHQQFGFMLLDVSVREKVESIMEKAVSDFGVPDVLINCAGRSYPRHFEDITYEQFDETMKINLYGIWNTTSVLVPHMKQKGGHISNVSSIAGFIGVFGFTDYSASKFAIIGFSEALKSELKKYNINVSVLCPPDTDTPAFEVENRTKPEETKAVSESAKLMQPEDVAAAFIRGILKGKFIIIPGMDGKFTFIMKRFFPKIVEWVMDTIIKKVQKKRGQP
jgi:short-subunit dehydrogenase